MAGTNPLLAPRNPHTIHAAPSCERSRHVYRNVSGGIVLNTTGPGPSFLHLGSTGGIIMELAGHGMPSDPWDLPNWRRDPAAGAAGLGENGIAVTALADAGRYGYEAVLDGVRHWLVAG